MREADERVHGTTHERPIDRFLREEMAALRPLPANPLPLRERRLRRKVANDALVDVDTVRYSVPHRLVRTDVEVLVGESEVRIYRDAELVATHPRTVEPHTSVIDFARYRGLWREPRQLPAAEPTRALEALGRSLADYEAAPRGRHAMSAIVYARVLENLARLRLGHLVERLDALLAEAARGEPTYLDFLDSLLRGEVDSKQRKRVAMGMTIAHFPSVKTLEEFDFKSQPSIDQRLVRELATGRFIAQTENVLLFGPPGVGKTHLAIALGRAVVEAGHSVLFTSATALLGALSRSELEGELADKLAFYAKPKLLIVDELGT